MVVQKVDEKGTFQNKSYILIWLTWIYIESLTND